MEKKEKIQHKIEEEYQQGVPYFKEVTKSVNCNKHKKTKKG